MRCILFFVLMLLFATPLLAQKQANIWYFGQNAGLDFNSIDSSGNPAVLTDGQVNTDEGCSVISDESGNLLFYTDGVTVWNRWHEVMPNGTDLKGSFTSTQSALIVPQPRSNRYYYIFTTADQGKPDGLNYSLVDMDAEDGYGDVIVKNVQLYTPTTEKLTAVHHANGEDIWVITHKWESDEFYVYRVTRDGLDETPVINKAGSVHEFGVSNANAIGQMKVSSHGKMIGLVIRNLHKIETFDFNLITGLITFQDSLIISIDPDININIYGLGVSVNEKYLYLSEEGSEFYSGQNIYQYDLLRKKISIIDTVHIGGGLQLGPDRKMYVVDAGRKELLVIERPNLPFDHSDFKISRISIAPGTNHIGLPNFIQSYFSVSEPQVVIPNAFTPNGDGINDRFKPGTFTDVETFHMKIMDRTGNEIYRIKDDTKWWDGAKYPAGVYYWSMYYEGVNGREGFLKGWVRLLR